jgi:chemotaxis protein histidine kinase CheA
MSVDTEDEFQKELIEVFVQEAQEWLQQIHVALDELQQGPAPDRHLKLAQTIKAGIASLGGSAATISLSDVERASFSTLPFVEAVQDPTAKISADDFIALCKHLGHIHTALTRATGVTFDAESATTSPDSLPAAIPTTDLLAALHGLRERQAKFGSFHRNLVQTVIAQVQGLMNNGIGQCDGSSIREFLDRLAAGEEGFFQLVQQQLSNLTDELRHLKNGVEAPGRSRERLQAVVEQVAQLWSAAQQVNAAQAMTFFMGLHSFLTVVMQQRVVVTAKKYEAVESRLLESMKIIQGWVEAGRAERTAIGSVLPN